MFVCCSFNKQFVVDSLHSIGNNPKTQQYKGQMPLLCSQTKGHESGLFYRQISTLQQLCLWDAVWTLRFNFRFNFNDFRLFFSFSFFIHQPVALMTHLHLQNKIVKTILASASCCFAIKSPSHRVAVIISSMAIAWKWLKIGSAFRMRTSSIYCIFFVVVVAF